MLVSAATQNHTCKALLLATAHGARTTGFCFVGFHVIFRLSMYGGGHHGKGTMGVHVGFHVGFQPLGYGGGHQWERYRGGPCWLPCWLPCWFPCWFRGHHGKGTIEFQVGFHVGFQLSRHGQSHHRVDVGCDVGFHVGFQLPGYGASHHGKDTGWVPCSLLYRSLTFSWTGCSKRTFPCWVEVLEPLRLLFVNVEKKLEVSKCPRGFGGWTPSRRPRQVRPKSSSRCVSSWVTGKLVSIPGFGPETPPGWVEVLEPLRLASPVLARRPRPVGSKSSSRCVSHPRFWPGGPARLGRSPRAVASRIPGFGPEAPPGWVEVLEPLRLSLGQREM